MQTLFFVNLEFRLTPVKITEFFFALTTGKSEKPGWNVHGHEDAGLAQHGQVGDERVDVILRHEATKFGIGSNP
jgi:hypothetical protein